MPGSKLKQQKASCMKLSNAFARETIWEPWESSRDSKTGFCMSASC